MREWVKPGETVGVIGEGIETLSLIQSTQDLGYRVSVYNPHPTDIASQSADRQFIGEYTDEQNLVSFAQTVDTLIYMTHLVPAETISSISENINVPQQDMLISLAQDISLRNAFLETLDIAIPDYMTVVSTEGLEEAVEKFGYPLLMRRNQTDWLEEALFVIESETDLDELLNHQFRGTYIAEPLFPEAREFVVSVAKTRDKEVLPGGITELKYRDNHLYQAVNPPQIEDETVVEVFDIANKIAEGVDFQGLFTIEFYLHTDGRLEVKGLEPFTHPGAHYTTETANLSQYDILIRALLGWPIPKVEEYKESVMVPFYIEHREKIYQEFFDHPDWLLKVYHEEDKDKPQGHLLLLAEDITEALGELAEIQLWK